MPTARQLKRQRKPNTPANIGRPAKYSLDITRDLCNRLMQGNSLRATCEQMSLDITIVYDWLQIHPEFAKLYAQAREVQADFYADNILETIDNASSDRNEIERAKIKAEALKWIASKLKPKRYGDKLDLTSDGEKLEQPIYGGLSVAPPKKSVIEAEIIDTKQLEAKHKKPKS